MNKQIKELTQDINFTDDTTFQETWKVKLDSEVNASKKYKSSIPWDQITLSKERINEIVLEVIKTLK
jgi:hypothetical protein